MGLEMLTEDVVLTPLLVEVCAVVRMGEIIELEGMISRDIAPALLSVFSFDDWNSVVGQPEEDAPPVPIEEEEVPERFQFLSESEVFRLGGIAVEDQVGQYGLLLLPEILGVAPVDFDRTAISGLALDHVPATAAELVDSDLGHVFTQPIRHAHHFSQPGRACPAIVAGDASQVPGDLQVVADDGPVLVLAISLVGVPFLIEFLVDKRNVRVGIGELVNDQVGSPIQNPQAGLAEGGELLLSALGQRIGARTRLIRYAGRWSPTEFQFFWAELSPRAGLRPLKVTGSMCEK